MLAFPRDHNIIGISMQSTTSKTSSRLLNIKHVFFLSAGLILIGWLLSTPTGLLGKADAIGYAVCHRIDLRSFHIADRPVPLCARCTGMYLGAVLALIYQHIHAGRRSGMPIRSVQIGLGIAVLAFAIDGINSYISIFPNAPSLYTPNNILRIITGTGMGITIGTVLYPAFNQTIWRDGESQPVFRRFRDFVGLPVLGLITALLVLTENPMILYPLSIVSAAGVLLILTITYSMAVMIIFKKEQAYSRIVQALIPLTAGFVLAIVQIALIDILRFFLTGTWDGFHIG
jgi:uncharacterized membrane protein